MGKLYNKNKWLDIINDKKYQDIRDKIKNAFKDLVFYEGPHEYYLGDRKLTCVSDVTHMFVEPFDTELKAEETSNAHFDDIDSKYYQKTKEDILEMWRKINVESTTTGTARHNFGESCFYFMCGWYDDILPEFKDRLKQDENGDYYMEAIYPKEEAVIKFWQDLPRSIVPILAENKTYVITDEFAYSGTFDILFYYDAELDGKDASKSGLMIFDYKTNKDLYKNFKKKKLLSPFDDLLDMDLSIYKLQLSLYEINLNSIDLSIIGRRIIWLLPNGTYQKIALESYADRLIKTLKKTGIVVHE